MLCAIPPAESRLQFYEWKISARLGTQKYPMSPGPECKSQLLYVSAGRAAALLENC